MIERLIEADRLLALGLTDQAERICWQAVETDPRNAIAVVGLARVALERGDDRTALELSRRALAIDPESPAAIRMTARLEEVIAARGETVPAWEPAAPPTAGAATAAGAGASAETGAGAATARGAATGAGASVGAAAAPAQAARPPAARPATKIARKQHRGLLGRLFGGR